MISKIKNALTYPKRIINLCNNGSSYYPDSIHKSKKKQLFELFLWMFRYGEVNDFYYLWGFDLINKKKELSDYQPIKEFMRMRTRTNNNREKKEILRNKLKFFKYMITNEYPVPKVFGVIKNNHFFDLHYNPLSDVYFLNYENYFCKAIDGECGDKVKYIQNFKDLSSYRNIIDSGEYILQEKINQHSKMNILNSKAVNTIRIVTVNDNGIIKHFYSILRIGTKESGERDNTSQGGIAVGIDQDGCLVEFGIRKPEFGGRINIHPDSNVLFEGFKIPYYKEAVELCCKAHSLFFELKSIGWDIAISEDGPVFVEGNDNWEIQTIQAIYGGQRKAWHEICSNR